MSKTELIKKVEELKQKIEQKTCPEKNVIVIKMWCVGGVDPPYNGGRTRIVASNRGEKYEQSNE